MAFWSRFTGDEIRRLVIDANDGMIVGAGIMEGLSLADQPEGVAITAALAALFSGAFSVAGANYSEISTDKDSVDAFLAEERRLRVLSPEQERAELTQIYVDKGLTPELARQVAEQLPAQEALADHAVEELGISPDAVEQFPALAALLSGLAFALGSLIPIIAMLVTPDEWNQAVLVTSVLGGVSLTSWIAARSSRMNTWRTVRRTLLFAAAAMLVSAAVGVLA
ncbi:Predicted Fe2+/Mn2+ transporter, VIT1/CCC1 family [Tessaracoccus bendigoensis DSM 12906]|uniref:Predicted Fe2+/Mn2+ transporter, VIT1/CCC1 family n=1 Tax=Tessaracoccus bendigoensis DSM 12906 TaxID=1123357 RepID=A0A1M6LQV7_9ACTN|nr:VIT1/CCC1 transporter family protein [Tessaracoccus bendigoensis]SHJ73573.1 Predicted Fe2+/Mn2+ transporter, VIT1/CCC1 family [Tessaracoccus bendigoensis DSM 12906]